MVCTHIARQVRGTPAAAVVVAVVEALNANLTNPMTTTTTRMKHVDHGE
jgi:5-hydroxyisourate hydrolase-like protein (transthyretin family)